MDRTHEGRHYRAIICKFFDSTKWLIQSLRYPVSEWTRSQAISHCREHEGTFEDVKPEAKIEKRDLEGKWVPKRQIIRSEDDSAILIKSEPDPDLEYPIIRGKEIDKKGLE